MMFAGWLPASPPLDFRSMLSSLLCDIELTQEVEEAPDNGFDWAPLQSRVLSVHRWDMARSLLVSCEHSFLAVQ
ncbi:uncharacterized protein CLUP02_04467 [Colletotrichum lupini]|uniref:Uncharacterized protein n=1 Tax=Colletotrichum lupini TaxID=145971 RepID=A0A9Q8SKQ5_9PEZI|nr:uncharacterized protein CLUP02_04467 [Colletotrichum lupini]UQC78988.1 hypothetical protein CLUP02_04467 [Colletotrichum lupini]